MWSLDGCKIVYFQYDFFKESSKIKAYHVIPIMKCLFFNVFSIYVVQKMAYLRYVLSGHIESKAIYYNALFAAACRNAESIRGRLAETVLAVTGTDYYHSN